MNEAGYRTNRGWKFTDLYTFQVISHSPADLEKVRDDYVGAFKPPVPGTPSTTGLGVIGDQPSQVQAKSGIVIKIAATHAGLITRNNGLYMPDKMRAAVSSWTEHYPKPIQIHHNDSPGDSHDPIGRVLSARYVDTVNAAVDQFQNSVLHDSFNKEIGKADKKFWDAFTSDKTSFIRKLDMLRMMDSVLNDPHYHGVGYIELTANITDPTAIPKILDGRYITGSVGAVSDKAVCSVCNTDWLEEEHCGHKPGRIYDGKKCVVVAGNLEYDEYSFVNTPADRHSGVLNIQNNVITDSADTSVKFFPVFSNKMEDSTMTDPNTTTQVEPEVKTPVEEVKAAETPVVQDAAVVSEQPVDELTPLLDKLFSGTNLSDEENEKLYELQLSEMDKEVIEDAKLSTARRKKLPSSTFCGPGKSFPVPDCAHVTAARRLIGRYKGGGSKESILACVSRKAKAMGCGGKDSVFKDNVQEVQTQVQEVVQPKEYNFDFSMKTTGELTDETKLTLAKEFITRFTTSELKDALLPALLASGLISDPEEVKTLTEEVAKNEEIIGDLRDQLLALRKELKAAYEDMSLVEDQLIESKESLRSTKVERLRLLHKVTGSITDEVEKNFATLSEDSLDKNLVDLSTKFDTEKIADRLNSGLSRIPEEKVDVPAGLTEPSAETKLITKPTFATQQMVDQVYRHMFITEKNPAKAEAYYLEMVKRGLAEPKQ